MWICFLALADGLLLSPIDFGWPLLSPVESTLLSLTLWLLLLPVESLRLPLAWALRLLPPVASSLAWASWLHDRSGGLLREPSPWIDSIPPRSLVVLLLGILPTASSSPWDSPLEPARPASFRSTLTVFSYLLESIIGGLRFSNHDGFLVRELNH